VAITTYDELKTAVANYVNRADLTARIPEFISLAEARISRQLRRTTVTEPITLTASAASISLPATAGELRYLRMNDGVYQFPLEITSPVAVADLLSAYGNVAGVPKRAAVLEGELYLAPMANDDFTAEISYFEKLVALSSGNPSNSVLADAPDLYLAGALVEAFLYLEYDERVTIWEAKFEAALDELNTARERAEFAAAPAPVRLPVVFE
jgi:hypothetical protein